MIKNPFKFNVKAPVALDKFKFLFWLCGHAEKWLYDVTDVYDVTNWEINNYNTYIARYPKK